jgi:hypothetical protein
MRNLNTFFPQCLLALALFGHGLALASPVFHVTVNTVAYTGQGLMDFTFLANAGATPATAVLNNFSGAFGATFDRSSAATGAVAGELATVAAVPEPPTLPLSLTALASIAVLACRRPRLNRRMLPA